MAFTLIFLKNGMIHTVSFDGKYFTNPNSGVSDQVTLSLKKFIYSTIWSNLNVGFGLPGLRHLKAKVLALSFPFKLVSIVL